MTRRAPHGFYLFCGSVSMAAAAVIAVNLAHHTGAVAPQASGPHAVPSSSATAVPVSLPPVASTVAPSSPGASVAGSAAGVASRGGVSPSRPSPVPSRSPAPHPSPAGPVLGVSASVVAPVRGVLPVRVVVAVPGAPPFPTMVGPLLP